MGVNAREHEAAAAELGHQVALLVDDLGTTLVRLDCYGKADWLDPAKRGSDGAGPHWMRRPLTSSL